MADIVLSTLNAKYIHAAFGLRYLLANLAELQERACIVEFDLQQRANDVAEVLLARKPKMLVTVALANKTARIAWALLVKGGVYRAPVAAA